MFVLNPFPFLYIDGQDLQDFLCMHAPAFLLFESHNSSFNALYLGTTRTYLLTILPILSIYVLFKSPFLSHPPALPLFSSLSCLSCASMFFLQTSFSTANFRLFSFYLLTILFILSIDIPIPIQSINVPHHVPPTSFQSTVYSSLAQCHLVPV